MLKLDFISARGNILPLVGNPYFDLIGIDGQTVVSTNLSSNVIGGIDGDEINNAQAQPRSIVLSLHIKSGVNVEEAKRHILQYIKPKLKSSLEWTQRNRTVIISGIVESIEMPRWNNSVTMQVTLHCSQPFWEDVDYVVQTISEAINHHYFTDYANDMLFFPEEGIVFGEFDTTRTKTFNNDGDVAVGIEITISALATVTNPIIYNQDGKFFGIGYGTDAKQLVLESGDTVKISTIKGKKSVTLNGINLLDKVKPNSTWLQLESGENSFSINSEESSVTNMYFNIEYKQRYI